MAKRTDAADTKKRRGKKPGPKPVFSNTRVRDIAIRLAGFGLHQRTIADWLGITEDTIQNAKKRDPEFSEQFSSKSVNAKSFAIAKLIENVQKGDQRAIEYFLKHIARIETPIEIKHSGDSENPLHHKIDLAEHFKAAIKRVMEDDGDNGEN